MEAENPVDFNGSDVISKYDILSEDLICKIKNLNPVLGSPDDPYYPIYEKYRDEMDNAELIIVDANALNRSSVNNLDLSGDNNADDLPSNFFQFITETLATAFGNKEFSSLDNSNNEYKEFKDYSGFNDVEYSSLCGGHY